MARDIDFITIGFRRPQVARGKKKKDGDGKQLDILTKIWKGIEKLINSRTIPSVRG